MATLSPGTSVRTGLDTVGVAAAVGGDKFANDGQSFVLVKNGDGSDHTVTFAIQKTVDGIAPVAVARNVVAGTTKIFGPFPTDQYNDTNGDLSMTYSAVTSVTVKVVKCPPAG